MIKKEKIELKSVSVQSNIDSNSQIREKVEAAILEVTEKCSSEYNRDITVNFNVVVK